MGNLFLKERENWTAWIIWSLIGCSATVALSSYTSQVWMSLLAPILVLGLLTTWMSYTKRFDFSRAFKVLSTVVLFSSIPVIVEKVLPAKNAVIGMIDSGIIVVGMVIASCVFAYIAKRPKQYY
ncbi:hypothetical protein [Pseudoalteromonas piscicida]|uniref:Uncharacterized protein n=1 Tax=Pseudoalteromonas piscicida TaxID=43662 RepID=A0A2A5JJW8_PSEO7|nr:hypothetical protein [Pseudoalteromonas piscicida]PCK29728.1 hypothetical protein CEX98_21395 [Pseudoalteromonas piscicida]